jgi:hypothetical protein
MLGFMRRRPNRPESARRRPASRLEALEDRQLLTGFSPVTTSQFTDFYKPSILIQPTLVTPNILNENSPQIFFTHPAGINDFQTALLSNEGKVLTGKDRQGNEWQITVHGPGVAIVTDATPNDGVLDDDIDTIQLVGTDPQRTYVTGQVSSSAREVTDGTVVFNHLVSDTGVASIILNGFTLARTVIHAPQPPNPANADIYLPAGVGVLSFHNIVAPTDLGVETPANTTPFTIVIGDPNTPLTVKPVVHIDSIFNTVFNSTELENPNGTPQTTPTVSIIVNGVIHGLDMVSATAQPVPGGQSGEFPIVGTTGRTAVRALGIDNLRVAGSAVNFTASRAAVPFQNGFSGLNHIGHAAFGGNADAVGLDVNGPIGGLSFVRGLGNPTGSSVAPTSYGTPDFARGYPSFGLLGGLITATKIGRLRAAPANSVLLTPQDPDLMMRRQGSTNFHARPGNALTSAAIVSSGNIGTTTIVGDSVTSEIASGFHYPSYTAGLEPERAPSSIRPVHQRGDLVDSVVAATYRPNFKTGQYGTVNIQGQSADIAGPGTIKGNLNGSLFTKGAQNALRRTGVGFFARTKIGYLPPPESSKRVNSVLTRP